jgi:hypothetical protein
MRRGDTYTATLAGIGSGYGFVVWRALADMHEWPMPRLASYLIAFVLLVALTLLLIDPLRKSVHGSSDARAEGVPHDRPVRTLAIPFLILLGVEFSLFLVHHEATEHVADTLADLSAAVFIVGTITFAWLAASRKGPSRTAMWGFVAGTLAGLLYVWLKWAISGGRLVESLSGALVSKTFGQATAVGLNNGLLFWGLLGLCGGLVLRPTNPSDLGWRMMIVLLGVTIASNLIFGGPLWADILKVVGWAAVLWIRLPDATSTSVRRASA